MNGDEAEKRHEVPNSEVLKRRSGNARIERAAIAGIIIALWINALRLLF